MNMVKTSTPIHIKRVPHKSRWNIQVLVSYVLAIFACVLTNGGVFVAFYRWDYLWLFVSLVGIVLILVGAILNFAGSRITSNKNQRPRSVNVQQQAVTGDPFPPNTSLSNRNSCRQADRNSNVPIYETLSSNAKRSSRMLSSAPLLNVNGQNYLLLSIPSNMSEAETRRLSNRLSTVVQVDFSDILKKSEQTGRQKQSTIFSSTPANCQNSSNCNINTKQDNLIDSIITCQALNPLPENERTSSFVPNVDSVLKENVSHNEHKCAMTQNSMTIREPKIGSLENHSGTSLHDGKQTVLHCVQEPNEDIKREVTIMSSSRHQQTVFMQDIVEQQSVDIQCCIETNLYDSIKPTPNDKKTSLGKTEHNEQTKDSTEVVEIALPRTVIYDLPREPRSFHRKEVLPKIVINNLSLEQSNILNLQSDETHNDRCLSQESVSGVDFYSDEWISRDDTSGRQSEEFVLDTLNINDLGKNEDVICSQSRLVETDDNTSACFNSRREVLRNHNLTPCVEGNTMENQSSNSKDIPNKNTSTLISDKVLSSASSEGVKNHPISQTEVISIDTNVTSISSNKPGNSSLQVDAWDNQMCRRISPPPAYEEVVEQTKGS